MRLPERIGKVDRRQWPRYATMVLGILALAPPTGFLAQAFGGATLCGPLCSRMAIGSEFFRELSTRTAGVALLGAWLGTTLFSGRWLCSHFCPVGALTEFASRLVPGRFKIDYCRALNAPLFRYGFLAAFVGLPLLGVGSICCAYCTFNAIPGAFGALFAPESRAMLLTGSRLVTLAVFGMALGVLSRDGRGHCHLACPVGALDSLANTAGARLPFTWRLRIRPERCSGCGLCAKRCPASAIRTDAPGLPVSIDPHRCHQCRACQAICPKGAIEYGRCR